MLGLGFWLVAVVTHVYKVARRRLSYQLEVIRSFVRGSVKSIVRSALTTKSTGSLISTASRAVTDVALARKA